VFDQRGNVRFGSTTAGEVLACLTSPVNSLPVCMLARIFETNGDLIMRDPMSDT